MKRDHNEERRAVKQVFGAYRRNQALLSTAARPAEAQLALDWSDGGEWRAVDDVEIQKADARRYNKKVWECAKNYLSAEEWAIIHQSYMSDRRLLPWQIFEPLHMERTQFYTTKAKAIGKLYVLLRMQRLLKSTD